LFGFQLVAVFNEGFHHYLSENEQRLHLLAIVLIAIALVMAPAALHRQSVPQEVTEALIRISTRLLLWSMVPLAVSICLDFYLVARIILDTPFVALLALLLLATFVVLWLVLPRVLNLQKTR
jgi:hypothetical protein